MQDFILEKRKEPKRRQIDDIMCWRLRMVWSCDATLTNGLAKSGHDSCDQDSRTSDTQPDVKQLLAIDQSN